MIRFKPYNNGQIVENMVLNGSHLFGQDEIPVRSQLDFAHNELLGLRHSDIAVGLVTLWDINEYGKMILQTTRLPERNDPYNLNVELARGRLLRISQKREEWSMNELPLTEHIHELIDTALNSFVMALSCLDVGDKASLHADESLRWALRAGEEMALAHAHLFLQRRRNNQGVARYSFACCLDPTRLHDENYLKHIKSNFSFVTLPISWRQIEAKEQERNFELLDEWIDWLSRNRIAIKVGPLLNFSPSSVPDWLYIWENDFEQIRDMAYDYITALVQRYADKVHAWEVVSGMNVENCFKLSFEQIIEMSRSAVLAARHAAPRAVIIIDIAEPWGDYYAYDQRTIPPMVYIDMMCQSGANFNAVGVKLRFGRGGAGMQTRDLLDVSHLLDRIGVFGKTLHLTGVQVPSAADIRDNTGATGPAGYWRQPWSPEIQAEWLDKVYRIALSKSLVESITWQDLVDRDDAILQNGGLLKSDFTPKPAFQTLCQLKKELTANRK
ncbi:MAG: endo-1,4-beta-xylanase [Sedimentisphaerales bacterium]|nr:endo-1,4-beta-xylanase [Sedimentisphaerales bacterium]